MKLKTPLYLTGRSRIFLSILGMMSAALGTASSQIAWSSDFESLDVGNPSALTNASWKAFVNVYNSGGTYLYGYSSTPPLGGSGFWAITTDQAGPEQGIQGLSIYGDYYNQGAQNAGNLVEVNAFQEFIILTPDDTGLYQFSFDAKAGNLASPSKATAFIKVLNPSSNYATVASATLDTSALPVTWGSYSIQLGLDDSMDGMVLQFGFSATSSRNVASGVFYDNLEFGIAPPTPSAPFAVTEITKSGNTVNVTFPSETGFNYTLLKSIDGMVTFDPVPTQPVISGDGSVKTVTDTAATQPSAYYRVRRTN